MTSKYNAALVALKSILKKKGLPSKVICLSCLAEQSTLKVIANDDTCIVCGREIDVFNLSDVEV